MTKIVYVTGCLGLIGGAITRKLLDQGHYVLGVDKETYASNLQFLDEFASNSRFKYIKSDINDLERLVDCDYVINTAAETHVDNSIVGSDIFLKDMLVQAWARTFNIPYVILRPTNNYGIGQYVEKLIPKTIKYIQLGRRVDLHDQGKPQRTWLHVDDTANAVQVVINSGVKNEIFNISGNYEHANLTVVNKIFDNFSIKFDYNTHITDLARPGQDVRYAINDDKLRSLVWEPEADFDVEIARIVEYYRRTFVW